MIKPFEWKNGKVVWLDVSRLPHEEVYYESSDLERLAKAIERMEVRGAPAIGVFAALSFAATIYNKEFKNIEELLKYSNKVIDRLSKTRPTAYNLFWALDRMKNTLHNAIKITDNINEIKKILVNEALQILNEDIEQNMKIGRIGSELIEDGDVILTHCNTGSLATAGYGTALGVIRAAWEQGKNIKVIATETRPLLQGARLTVWELVKDGIPVTLITDNMIGYVMSKQLVSKVIVGADRILLDGHVINKIGTYTIAVLADRHKIPFYVAAPTSTIDPKTTIDNVVIEERDPNEVRTVLGKVYITVPNVPVLNPAFDITPPELVKAIITEKGVIHPPYNQNIRRILKVK